MKDALYNEAANSKNEIINLVVFLLSCEKGRIVPSNLCQASESQCQSISR